MPTMRLSELPESKSVQPTLLQVAPLALSTVKHCYPRLLREYASLSERQMSSLPLSHPYYALESPIDCTTRQRTTIFFKDFAAPLSTEGDATGVPMKADYDANRFSVFVWKCLGACESGSVGGDPFRQFGVLNAALDDAVTLASKKYRFLHLLSWTCAAFNHGMHSMMYRYCPYGIRSLLLAAAAEWRKIFEVIPKGDCGAPEDVEILQEGNEGSIRGSHPLVQLHQETARKEAGDHRRHWDHAVNVILSVAAVPVTATATTAKAVDKSENDEKRSDKLPPPKNLLALVPNDTKKTVKITVVRPTEDHPLRLCIVWVGNALKVKSINAPSLFLGTQLTAGMLLEMINGEAYATFAEGMDLVKNAVGKMVVVASFPIRRCDARQSANQLRCGEA
jgi:hypothetical protein